MWKLKGVLKGKGTEKDQYDEKKRTFPGVMKVLTESGYETRLTMGYMVHAWK